MNSINVNIPVVNLPQVSHHQSEVHRVPIIHQTQNADLARDRLDLQMRTAQEAEQAEGKIIDPNDHKEEEKRKSRKREKDRDKDDENGDDEHTDNSIHSMSDSGQLVDLEA
ncbi:MAG: hypothetical protein LBU70_01175 [Chitinispirillales bacterium]|jgi:hypothetical protein|nr:hypothetical protein [Chitinispirillales bacterium]